MKLLTLNTHSLIEDDYETKLESFVSVLSEKKPDIAALQEVNQRITSKAVNNPENFYAADSKTLVREDNHAYRAVKMLKEKGCSYYWTYNYIKNAYGEFEEGLAILSLKPINKAESVLISRTEDETDWKTRKMLSVTVKPYTFCNLHMGRWDDSKESFFDQWQKLMEHIKVKENKFLMGDFNAPDSVRGEGYDLVISEGFTDLSEDKGRTVQKSIDGWRDKDEEMRIDYIFSGNKIKTKKSSVIFDGKHSPKVSDHFGVMVTI